MDLTNLEKMKVVDLRNELQTRGLDHKGVKAVLIERLRAHLEVSGDTAVLAPPSPCTPGRRSRRTRSMTRSPSPSPEKKPTEPLETLEEEGNSIDVNQEDCNVADKTEIEAKKESTGNRSEINDQLEHITQTKSIEDEKCKRYELEETDKIQIQATNGSEKCEDRKQDDSAAVNDSCEFNESEKVDDGNEDGKQEEQAKEENNSSEKAETEEDNIGQLNETTASKEKLINSTDLSPLPSNSDNREKCPSRSRSRSLPRSRSRSPHKYRSNSHSTSPKRRSSGGNIGSPIKAIEDASTPEDEPSMEDNQFGLSWFDSDLHLRIDPVTFTSAKPINHDIYALVWSGARANYGVREGKVCFEVCLSDETNLGRDHAFREEPFIKGFRAGFSTTFNSLLLGDEENSFAYCESGKKATNGEFMDFSKPFQVDDVIACYLDLDSTPCSIRYSLNGEDLGVAFEFDKSILGEDEALYPHILTKGYEFQVNFADNDNLLVNRERKVRKKRKTKVLAALEKVNEEKDVKKINELIVNQENNDEEDWDKDQATEDENNKNKDEVENDFEADKTNSESKSFVMSEKDHEENKNDIYTEEISKNQKDKVMEVEDKKEESEADTEQQNKITEDEFTPSPSKRKKVEVAEGEDEFEEIHPVPRAHMSLLSEFELIALIPEEKYIIGPQRPESRKECEVILMVGLPGSGKTTWALNHIKQNPKKRYDVIGADALIAKMKVDGNPRWSVHKGRFDRVYELCFNVLTSLEDIALKRRRNYILDQANVYASAQRRKMKGFGDFKRKAIVCIPNEEELKRRLEEKKEKGNAYTMKDSILHGLQANFNLPLLELSWFDEVVYTDLSGDEAKEEVKKYNEKGKKASNKDKRQRRDNHGNDNRRRYDERRRYDNRNDNRWNDRRTGGVGGGYHGGGGANRWGAGGYRPGGGYRDDRGYGGGVGGGVNTRGYDQRRYSSGPQNWVQNNRNRYDDRSNSRYSSGGVSHRYDAYGSGGSRDYRGVGNDNREYRDRHRGATSGNSAGGTGGPRRDNSRSGGSTNQRDFRPGHRDTREDSRGGQSSTKVAPTSSNYIVGGISGGNSGPAYDKYKKIPNYHHTHKYNAYQQHQQPQTQSNNWAHYNLQQQNAASGQQYWNYDAQNYGGNQQWQTMDPQQQQQWMSWWQQQGGNVTDSADPNHYWSQYCYTTPAPSADAAKK